MRPSPAAWLTLVAGLAAFAVTLARPDMLPAIPFVDQILWTPFTAAPLAATALWTGTLLLFAPAVGLWRGGQSGTAAAFAVVDLLNKIGGFCVALEDVEIAC